MIMKNMKKKNTKNILLAETEPSNFNRTEREPKVWITMGKYKAKNI
jgi:hypothetical protein